MKLALMSHAGMVAYIQAKIAQANAADRRRYHQTGRGRRTVDTIHTGIRNKYMPHCGARECARNMRRIGAGEIRPENGFDPAIITPGKVEHHGME